MHLYATCHTLTQPDTTSRNLTQLNANHNKVNGKEYKYTGIVDKPQVNKNEYQPNTYHY